jgi:hypothetical protein
MILMLLVRNGEDEKNEKADFDGAPVTDFLPCPCSLRILHKENFMVAITV